MTNQIVYSPHPVFAQANRRLIQHNLLTAPRLEDAYLGTILRANLPDVVFDDVRVYVNDELITTDEIDTYEVKDGDHIAVRQRAHGGDGSNPLQIILMIVVYAIAFYVAGPGGAMAVAGYGSVAQGVAFAAIMVAGTLIVNALFPPAMPSMGQDAGTTYNISGQSNRARPNEPLPLVVGTHKVYADLGAAPFTTQTSEDIFLHQVFNFGFGDLTITDVKIGDTLIANYEEVESEWGDSNGQISLFPTNVDQVAGAALNYEDDWVTRTTSIDTTRIEVDIAGTLFATDKEGKFTSNFITLAAEYRAVGSGTWLDFLNTAGQPATVEQRMARITTIQPNAKYALNCINDDTKPYRKTMERVVPKGQYEVRIKRLTPTQTSRRQTAELNWTVMKCYQTDDTLYTGQNRLGVRVRASGQFNGTIQELNALVSTRIPVWNGSTWVTQASSNPAYLFLYLSRGARDAGGKRLWGAGLPDARIDIEMIKEWGAWCAAKSLECNYIFGQRMSIAEMLTTVARTGRAGVTWQKGILGIVYDKENLPITQTFGMANIVQGSFNINYITTNLADEIVLKFINEDRNYETDEVRTLVPGIVTPVNPVEVQIPGVTTLAQAAKEAKLLAARQYFHRRTVSFETDFEGLVCGRGDVITVSHDLTNWGASGRLVSGTTTSLVLDREVTFESAAVYYAGVRAPDGTYAIRQVVNPYAGTPVTVSTITLASALPFNANTDASNLPHDYLFFFDPQATPGKRLKVTSVSPTDETRIKITAIDDVLEYYDEENGSYDYTPPPIYSTEPFLTDLNVVEKWQGFGQPLKINITWTLLNASAVRLRIRTNNLDWVDYGNIQGSEYNYLVAQYKPNDQLEIEVTPVQLTGAQKKGGASTVTYFIVGDPGAIGNIDVPNVTGLELYNAGNGNEFTGKDAKFVWRKVKFQVEEFGSETLGAETGYIDPMFEDYEVRIFDEGGTLRRKEYVKDESYTYTFEKNSEDGTGAVRTFRIAVYYRTKLNQISTTAATLLVTNPAPAAPSGLSITTILKNLYVKADRPNDLDLSGMIVWVSTSNGFTPGAGSEKHRGPETAVTIEASLNYDTTYYVRVAFYDGFGETGLNYSAQQAITPTQLDDTDVQVEINTRPGLIDTDDWVSPPTDPMGDWDLRSGLTANTSVDVSYNGPFAEPTPALIVSGTGPASAPGWFSKWHVPFSVTAKRGYVSYVWVLKKSVATNRGLYLGWTEGAGFVSTMAGVSETNAYFVADAGSTLTHDKWYLAVGVLNATSETVSSNLSGLWDPDTGTRVVGGTDYKHTNDTVNTQELRFGFYSNTTTFGTADGYVFARPSMYPMDGAEPSITGLLRRSWGQGLLATLDEVTANDFASGIAPIEIVGALPGTGNYEGRQVYLTTDNKMYRYDGTNWVTGVATADLSGTVDLNSQVSGTLTTAFAAAGLINSNVTVNANGTLTGAGGGQVSLTSLPGTIAAGQIAANAVIAGKIDALAVTAGTIAAGAVTTNTMTANTINGDRIAANTLDADKIVANSITAGKIQAGAIGTDQLAANSITAGKISITNKGQSINRDPQLSDLRAWFAGIGGTTNLVDAAYTEFAVTTQADGPVGTSVLRFSAPYGRDFSSERIPIDATKVYRISVWVKQSGTGNHYLTAGFSDANGSNISGGTTGWSTGTFHYWGYVNQPFPASWTKASVVFGPGQVFTIPTNAKFITIGNLTNYASAGSPTAYFSDYRIEEVIPGQLIVDGAITASKINVAQLSAINANMGSITAGTIALDSTGFIRSGQTSYNSGTGFWLGKDGATTKLSVGSSTKNMRWDGTNLNVTNADVVLDNGIVKRQLGTGFGTSNQFIDWFGPTAGPINEATGTFYIKTNGEAYFGGDIRSSFKTRAWARFYGNTVAYFTRQFNFASVVKAGTGRYTFTFATPLPNKYYCVIANCSNENNIDVGTIVSAYDVATTGFKLSVTNGNGNYRNTNLGQLVVYGSDEVVTEPPPGFDYDTDPLPPPGGVWP